MTDQLVTTDTILNYLEETVKSKQVLPPSVYVDACMKLNILLGDEHERLFDLQQIISKMKLEEIEKGASVAKAKVIAESSDEYWEMKVQEARIERIQEAIRISKHMARMKLEEAKGFI